MDEVDGMSAGDRGGVSALIALIKKTRVCQVASLAVSLQPTEVSQVPIICIANDDKSPKLKSLLHSAFRLSFRKYAQRFTKMIYSDELSADPSHKRFDQES